MNRAQFSVALLLSALVACLPLILVAWMTSGSWSPSHVRLLDLALVFPMIGAMKLGLGHVPALVVCFFTYWVIALGILARYIQSAGLEVKPTNPS